MSFSNIFLAITTLATALIAGLLYAYSCSVNLGLSKLPDAEYLAAMQSINREIQNPYFFMSFIGTLLFLPISTFISYNQPTTIRFWFLLMATCTYAIGVFGVTMFKNVPLNNGLEGINLIKSTAENMAYARDKFEITWNNFHFIRTVASIIALIFTILACLSTERFVK